MKRRLRLRVIFAAVIGAITATVMLASPAWAHHPVLSGETSCPNDDHLVTWTIGNSQADSPMTILQATAVLDGTNYGVTGYASPVAASASTTGTTTIPGDLTGTVRLSVRADWPDSFSTTRTFDVELDDPCPVTTTTTTEPSTTTTTEPSTTTTGPESTTTTTEPDSTTTTEPESTTTTLHDDTTTSSTPDTTVGGGTGTPTSAGPGSNLPRTGMNATDWTLVGLAAISAGGLMLWMQRYMDRRARAHPRG